MSANQMESTMNPMQKSLKEWCERFGDYDADRISNPPYHVQTLRRNLMKEELSEVLQAMDSGNVVNVAAELADLLYVVFGTAVAYGVDMQPVFDEIHRANMSKLNPDGSVTKNEYGKIIKPPTYRPADVASVIDKMTSEDHGQ